MSNRILQRGVLKHGLRGLVLLGLWLASTAAMALGLGEIRVRSQPGQPLVAEIPIISTQPGELEQLQARLASPGTFERVGLERPEGLVSGLDFAVAVNQDGRPVIRVTSKEPVRVDAVNFLVEVDWGRGRLVREYSALVSGPGALAAGSQPAIEAPLPAPRNTIVRESPVTLPSAEAVKGPAQAEPTVLAADPEPKPTRPSSAVANAPTVRELQAANGEIRVAQGQTLSEIARGLGQDSAVDQTMIALLRANPDAFIQGNINLLKAGAVLRVPPAGELAQLGAGEAAALVREQNAQWRNARAPILQPAATAAAKPAAPAPADAASGPGVAQARLEIAPPAASAANRAGTQSGIDADGEGDMLANQELTATREDLAARQSEVEELRAQVTELEGLQQQQAQLLALKDSELAAAQQQLAAGQGGAGQPLWLWGGLILLVLGLVVAYAISRRGKPAPAADRRTGYDSAAMAAVFDSGRRSGASETIVGADVAAAAASNEAVEADAEALAEREQHADADDDAPAWTAAPAKPTWHIGDAADGIAPMNAAPAGRERLELALAYIDLGDKSTARDLLNEVVAGGDEQARDEASQLLRELD